MNKPIQFLYNFITSRAEYLIYPLLIAVAFGSVYGTGQIPSFLLPTVSIISLFLFALPVIISYFRSSFIEKKKILIVFIILSVLGYALEILSVTTGIPYGVFTYSNSLGPLLFNTVPYSLPLAWPVVVIGVAAFTQTITHRWVRFGVFVGLLIWYDLVLDPVAVKNGMWVYQGVGVYYGVPLSNYIGWFISASIAAAIIFVTQLTIPYKASKTMVYHSIFWTTCAFLYGLYIPAFIGVLLCGILTIIGSKGKKIA